MKIIDRLIISLFIITLSGGCDKTEVISREFPQVLTLNVSDITKNGAIFNAEIIQRTNADIIDYGFIWDQKENLDPYFAEKVIFPANPPADKFSADIFTTLKPNQVYYVRSFVHTSDYTVYGNNISFTSLGSIAPIILSLSPESGTPGDTINILGKGFSYRISENIVKFGYEDASLISASDTILKVTVPATLETSSSPVSVEITGNTGRSGNPFLLSTPVIDSFTPDSGTAFTEVTIEGKNFCYIPDLNIVTFGDVQATVLEATKTRLRVKVPSGINQPEVNIKVSIAGQDAISSTTFTVL